MKYWFLLLVCYSSAVFGQKIDRKALVSRHNVILSKADTLASLTVGNGRFAYTVDVTGMQTFPSEYQKGVTLGTESEWGWHSFRDTVGYDRKEVEKNYKLNGRTVSYVVQWNSPQRNKEASNWFRQNPHRLQLGNVGLVLLKKDGAQATLADIQNIHQELNLWTGEIRSHFTVENVPVDVSTFCHGSADAIAVSIHSALIDQGRLKVYLRFPYPTGAWADDGTNWKEEDRHRSEIKTSTPSGATISHDLDTTSYRVQLNWNKASVTAQKQKHYFVVEPARGAGTFWLTANFIQQLKNAPAISFEQTKQSSTQAWNKYWSEGGAIDFTGSTDPRAVELERRIILSQYLMRAQEAGNAPPQETGLTYNSWFGKPHLEMTWWHAAHYALWGHITYLEQLMNWYASVAEKARKIAVRQGYDGIRWQKMTDNNGDEAPSSVGAFLVWQQPHYIYFAELCYREHKDLKTLNRYKDLVFATADFMASFARWDSLTRRYVLGKGLIAAQERFKAEETYNPAYELVYWKWALTVAQDWRRRLKLAPNNKWDDVIKGLSALPIQDNKYLFTESAKDSYTNPEFRTDHPSVLAALGVMPATGQVDKAIMQNTFNWIWSNWTWKDTWGWDFPMTAMTATRLGLPGKAVDGLLMGIQTNTYLPNGHNFQDGRLRIYLPGNGGLLMAAAMMVAGYDGSNLLPGIPTDGKWKVKWEGLRKMP